MESHATFLAFVFTRIEGGFLGPVGGTVLAVTGMAFGATQVFMLALRLRTTRPEFRGRVMGLRVLAIYAFTLSSIDAGAMDRVWGASWAATIVGAVGMALVVLLASFTRKLHSSVGPLHLTIG